MWLFIYLIVWQEVKSQNQSPLHDFGALDENLNRFFFFNYKV